MFGLQVIFTVYYDGKGFLVNNHVNFIQHFFQVLVPLPNFYMSIYRSLGVTKKIFRPQGAVGHISAEADFFQVFTF